MPTRQLRPQKIISPQISAVICTHNRAKDLRLAIQSLIDQNLPHSQFEIMIVDNASTDETKKIVRDDFSKVENLKYCYEPKLGLNHARNCGWQNASAKYIALLDDDAIASPTWLATILRSFKKITPTPGAIGGPVELKWSKPLPRWLPPILHSHLTELNLGPHPQFLQKRHLVGVNLAFPKKLAQKIGGFDPRLDRAGSRKLLSGGDTFFQELIRTQGASIYYHPQARIIHRVLEDRVSQKWFLRRSYWQGATDIYLNHYLNQKNIPSKTMTSSPNRKYILKNSRRLFGLIKKTKSPERFERLCNLMRELGRLKASHDNK